MLRKPITQIRERNHIQFDEANIRMTNPIMKNYGLKKVSKTMTPFPRNTNPVSSRLLRKRLEKLLGHSNLIKHKHKNISPSEMSFTRTSLTSNESDEKHFEEEFEEEFEEKTSWRTELFRRKRQQFDRHEFLIAKQRNMNYLDALPGPALNIQRILPEKYDDDSIKGSINWE